MKARALVAVTVTGLLSVSAQAATHYGDLASWSAAVGSFLTEDFESYSELRLPVDGGFTPLDHFAIYNDDQGDNEWTGDSGLYLGSSWYAYPALPDTMHLIISTEGSGDEASDGPLVIDAVFPYPISAFSLEYSWCEDESCVFDGFVFDEPVTQVSLWEPAWLNHSWGAIDAVHWTPVPEPSSGLLLLFGLVLSGSTRRAPSATSRSSAAHPSSTRSGAAGAKASD